MVTIQRNRLPVDRFIYGRFITVVRAGRFALIVSGRGVELTAHYGQYPD